MRGEEGSQVGLDPDGSHAWTSPAVRDTERLVEVEVRHVRPVVSRSAETNLGVHVGTVQVDLATSIVHQLAQRGDAGLEHAVGGGVGDHDAGQSVLVSLNLGLDVLHVHCPVSGGLDGDHLHARHLGGGWVGAVGRERNETDVPLGLSLVLQVGHDGHQACVLALGPAVRLEGDVVVPGDLAEVPLQLLEHLPVAHGLLGRGEGVEVGEAGEAAGHHLRGGVELHGAGAQRDHGVDQGDILVLQPLHVPHHVGLAVVDVEDGVGEVGARPLEL